MHVKFVFLLCTITISMVDLKAIRMRFDADKLLFWRQDNPDKKCEPFTSYLVECNKCICGAEGIPYCTRMICHDKKHLRRFLESESEIDY